MKVVIITITLCLAVVLSLPISDTDDESEKFDVEDTMDEDEVPNFRTNEEGKVELTVEARNLCKKFANRRKPPRFCP